MSLHAKYRAKFAFTPEHPEEAPLEKGELALSLSETTDGWIKVRTLRNNREGFVPLAYLEEIQPTPARTSARALPTMMPPLPSQSSSSSAATYGAPQPPPPSSATTYGAPQPGFLLPPAPKPTMVPPKKSSAGSVDTSRQNFDENLALWRERERRFLKGEAERLPAVSKRVYFYYNAQGVRIGPVSETQMKSRLEAREITAETLITPSVLPGQAEMPLLKVNDYFPDAAAAFSTAPVALAVQDMWLFIDDMGQVQGPFPAQQMRDWFNQGYFNEHTQARLAHKTDVGFCSLGLLFPDGEGAFLSEGRQPPPLSAQPPPPALAAHPAETGLALLGMAMDNPFLSTPQRNSSRTLAANPFDAAWEQPGKNEWQAGFDVTGLQQPPPPPPPQQQQQPGFNVDDWGITWDDEDKQAQQEPLPTVEEEPEKQAPVAQFAVISQKHLRSHEALYKFLTRGLPKDLGTVRCCIVRSMVGMMHINSNVYQLFLEHDDGSIGPEILVATKVFTRELFQD